MQTHAVDFAGFVGQDQAKNLLVQARAGRMNVLLIGSPGSGKTTLATIYLESFVSSLSIRGVIVLNGSQGIRELVTSIEENPGRPILLDEAHKLRKAEALYKYLSPQALSFADILRGVPIKNMLLPNSVFAFATTDEGDLPDALLSRLVKVALRPYHAIELSAIAAQACWHPNTVLYEIGRLSQGSPRRAKLLSQLLANRKPQNARQTKKALRDLGYPMGLNYREALMLNILVDGPAGIGTIAGMLSTGTKTVRTIESWLISAGLVQITSRGRMLTKKGMETAMQVMMM